MKGVGWGGTAALRGGDSPRDAARGFRSFAVPGKRGLPAAEPIGSHSTRMLRRPRRLGPGPGVT